MNEESAKEMERAVDKLEAMFKKAESDVEYMSRKLENEFQESTQDKDQTSPLELSRRLEQVKHDYRGILQEAEGVKKAQEEMVAGIKQQLQAASQAIQRLQQTSGAELPDVTEQEALVRSILGIPLSSAVPQTSQQSSSSGDHNSQNPQSLHVQVEDIPPSSAEDEENLSPVDTTFDVIEPSAAELRAQSDEFVPITDEEFSSVSDLIRGRAKLDDVNRVYRRLHEDFKTEGKKMTLSVPEMSKMGMKITGATGEAKLKTLRALKIVTITRTGAVKLL